MLTEIREKNLLSIDFISKLVGLTPSEYKIYENDKSGKLLENNQKLLNILTKTLGISKSDLIKVPLSSQHVEALARTYSKTLGNHDIKKIQDLAAFRDKI